MPPEKRIMLQSRLLKRLRVLNMASFDEYVSFIFDDPSGKKELYQMIGLVSTHKTNFFRENQHFEYITSTILEKLLLKKKHLKLWSAGCSTGEEVWTLAMVLQEYAQHKSFFTYDILGTDIAQNVLEHSLKGIYHKDTIEEVGMELKKKYFLRHKDTANPSVRIIPELRKNARFEWLNLMDNDYKIQNKFDIIFCRNVLIYFERETQAKVVRKLSEYLTEDGYLFLGHSESIINLKLPLRQLLPTVYQKL
jgi:chemotaxis protein methyltransferase CheR